MCMFRNMRNVNLNNHSSLFTQKKIIFIGKSRVWQMTEFSGAAENNSDFDSNTT